MKQDIKGGLSAAAQAPESRKPLKLENVTALDAQAKKGRAQVFFDTKTLAGPNDHGGILLRLARLSYTGVLLHAENSMALLPAIPAGLTVALRADTAEDLARVLEAGLAELVKKRGQESLVVFSAEESVLDRAAAAGLRTGLHQYVDDGASLHRSIQLGRRHAFLMIHFRDPTNIPLELVIASLQPTGTTLIKELTNAEDVDDAVVTFGVMEMGADGVMFSPLKHELMEAFSRRLNERKQERIGIETATVTRSEPVGMGYRSCIDLATLFTPQEGMVVGSTSQGGILCCPEVFYLPYMETRPFRVNAGGVHSYVYNTENRTNYMSELTAGSSVMVVGLDGKVRRAPVGRMKTEMRPLRLIEARFESGETVNVILQDDWHVRVFSNKGLPLNITELKAGDKVLAHKAAPGRHVGIKIDENILES
jgi:3-amino-4-hydroxybenzoic acid synthase